VCLTSDRRFVRPSCRQTTATTRTSASSSTVRVHALCLSVCLNVVLTVCAATPVERFSNVKVYKGHVAPISGHAPLLLLLLFSFSLPLSSHPVQAGAAPEEAAAGNVFGRRDVEAVGAGLGRAAHERRGAPRLGDGTLKLWEFASAACVLTLSDHSVVRSFSPSLLLTVSHLPPPGRVGRCVP
jgi:hypothetical protein